MNTNKCELFKGAGANAAILIITIDKEFLGFSMARVSILILLLSV